MKEKNDFFSKKLKGKKRKKALTLQQLSKANSNIEHELQYKFELLPMQ